MNKKICLISAVAGLVGLVGAEGRAAEAVAKMEVPARESAWRISVGGVRRFGIKSDFTVDPSAAIGLLPAVRLAENGRTKAEAMNAGSLVRDGVVVFENGFIDPVDCAGIPGETWNWRIDDANDFQGGKLLAKESFGTSDFRDERFGLSDAMEEDLRGISAEFGRSLYQKGRFGVDVVLGAAFFDGEEMLKSSGTVYRRKATEEKGTVVRKIDASVLVGEPDLVNPDGSIGSGTFDGPGPVLTYGTVEDLLQSDTEVVDGKKRVTDSTELVMSVSGDYQTSDFRLVVEPYYEVVSGLKLRGVLGVVYSVSEFEAEGAASVRGKEIWRKREKFEEKQVCGIAGVALEYDVCERFFVTAKAEVLLGVDALKVESDFVKGEIRQGERQVVLGIGVRF